MEIFLEKVKLAMLAKIGKEMAGVDIRVDCTTDYSNQMMLRIIAKVTCQKLETVCACYPADWREAFKERWFPGWALSRWPVRYKTVELTAWAKYPDRCIPNERCWIETIKSVWEDRDGSR